MVGRYSESKKSYSVVRNFGTYIFNYLFCANLISIMIRKILFLLLSIIVFAQCSKPEKKVEEIKKEVNELPHLAFKNLDGSPATTRDLPPASVLILFNTDCDHCQREAKSIQENLASFKDYTLLFISSDLEQNIQQFSKDYKLENLPNVRFGKAEGQDVYMNFGSIPTPSIYVYSKERRFIKSFMGETPVEQIILAL